jgi:hypothetical protein
MFDAVTGLGLSKQQLFETSNSFFIELSLLHIERVEIKGRSQCCEDLPNVVSAGRFI